MGRWIFFLLVWQGFLMADVKILCTAALIEDQFDSRKEEYVKCLGLLDGYGYIPKTFVVDACARHSRSFFESYAENVFYAGTNDFKWINKGVNEANAMMAALDHYAFGDEDMIIKLTGRYFLDSDLFLKTVEAHPEVDVFVKYDSCGQVWTGCYAMRCKYLKEFLHQIDLMELNDKRINIERKAAEYVQKVAAEKKVEIMTLDHLDVTANIFGWGTRDYTKW